MIRKPAGRLVLLLAAVIAGTLGCADRPTPSPGSIVVRVEWIEPAPAEERLGGFAFFARATGPDGPGAETEIRGELELLATAPAGYLVEVWARHESDAVAMEDVPGGTPRTVRTFGAVDAACSIEVDVASGETIRLVMRATPGRCELEPDVGRPQGSVT